MTMTSHIRKLLPLQEDHNPIQETPNNNYTSSSSTSSSCCYNNLKLNPPFDSAMALTVLVFLTALFFMGFFSIYIRRFADDSSVDPNRRRRSSNNPPGSATTTSYLSRLRDVSYKGVDPTVVKSLPVHGYYPGEGVHGNIEEMECAICLSEFEEKEWVKEIPYCGHVFHVECIDTWLENHVTCPLCRTAKLFAVEEGHMDVEVGDNERGLGVGEVQGDVESTGDGREVRLVVNGDDTWREEERDVGPRGGRRSSSCQWFGERVRLHRSFSF